jgi:hypothetical protein
MDGFPLFWNAVYPPIRNRAFVPGNSAARQFIWNSDIYIDKVSGEQAKSGFGMERWSVG